MNAADEAYRARGEGSLVIGKERGRAGQSHREFVGAHHCPKISNSRGRRARLVIDGQNMPGRSTTAITMGSDQKRPALTAVSTALILKEAVWVVVWACGIARAISPQPGLAISAMTTRAAFNNLVVRVTSVLSDYLTGEREVATWTCKPA